MRYSRGSKTEPWGRPYGTGTHGDLVDPWTTQKERFPRNDLNQQRTAPVTPKDICNRSSNISWCTVSNAALTSKSASKVSCKRYKFISFILAKILMAFFCLGFYT